MSDSQVKTQFIADFELYLSNILDGDLSAVCEAARYAALDGGKRIRPLCVYYGALASGNKFECKSMLAIAAAVELVHCYSLVHDDLPAMDNDDMRRGKPSTHKKFGEANGILAGDLLLTKAMQILCSVGLLDDRNLKSAAHEIAVGAELMIHGQARELSGCHSEEEFISMYSMKTGALIRAALRAGAICADASLARLECVDKFGYHLGLAFQLADDLLDEGEENSLLSLIGKQRTTDLLVYHSEQAMLCAENLNCSDELKAFAKRLMERKS